MIIDSHAHYSHRLFDQTFRSLSYNNGDYSVEESNRENLISKLRDAGVAASIEPAIGIESNEKVNQLFNLYPDFVFPAFGCHPTRTFLAKWKDRKLIDMYATYASNECVAVGETGLDYHYDRKNQHRLCQKRWFRYQIRLAHKLKKPLILHIRDADDDAIKILKKYRGILNGGVVHCFCGNHEIAKAYVNLGFHIGIGGALLTDRNEKTLSEVIRQIPLERIVLETDAPYVLPDIDFLRIEKKKNRIRNTSFTIYSVLAKIAEIKELPVSTAEKTIFDNTVRLFSLRSVSWRFEKYCEDLGLQL